MRRVDVPLEIDLMGSLRPLVASHQDPTIRLRRDRVARASRTPDGPATVAIERVGARVFDARAWGPGAAWALEHVPGLVGAQDDLTGFDPDPHPFVARAARNRPGLRIVRTGRIDDVLVATILAQRVTSSEAARSWTSIVTAWGEPAPGPYDLLLPPSPAQLAGTPYWAFHRFGVERGRATNIAMACRAVDRLQAAIELPRDQALASFSAVPGVGPWTAARVLRVAAGDADLVEVGDFHVKHHIGWNLAGEPRGSDERMLELLAPFSGHRGRVVRLVLAAGRRPPSFGPRHRVVPVDHL